MPREGMLLQMRATASSRSASRRNRWRETGAVRSSSPRLPVASAAAAIPSPVANQRRCGRSPRTASRCGRQSAKLRRRSRASRSRRLETGSRVKSASSETVASGVAQRSSSASSRLVGSRSGRACSCAGTGSERLGEERPRRRVDSVRARPDAAEHGPGQRASRLAARDEPPERVPRDAECLGRACPAVPLDVSWR